MTRPLSPSPGRTQQLDPFSLTPDCTPSDCEIKTRGRKVEAPTCGPFSKPKRKKVDFSPRQRDWFTKHGYTFERVERPNPWGAVTVDLMGFGDWLAFKPGEGILIVQTCRHSDASTRLKKAQSKPELAVWLKSGGRFAVHGWRQVGGVGSRWEVIVREVTAETG